MEMNLFEKYSARSPHRKGMLKHYAWVGDRILDEFCTSLEHKHTPAYLHAARGNKFLVRNYRPGFVLKQSPQPITDRAKGNRIEARIAWLYENYGHEAAMRYFLRGLYSNSFVLELDYQKAKLLKHALSRTMAREDDVLEFSEKVEEELHEFINRWQ